MGKLSRTITRTTRLFKRVVINARKGTIELVYDTLSLDYTHFFYLQHSSPQMLYKGDFVHTIALGNLEILHNYLLRGSLTSETFFIVLNSQYLGINAEGFIDYFANATCAESLSLLEQEDPTVIPLGSFLLPTFCDLHLHAPQFLYQGTGLHLPLMQWLNEYAFKAEERLDGNPQLAETVYKRLATRLLEHGTGAVLLFGTIKTETKCVVHICNVQYA